MKKMRTGLFFRVAFRASVTYKVEVAAKKKKLCLRTRKSMKVGQTSIFHNAMKNFHASLFFPNSLKTMAQRHEANQFSLSLEQV